MNRSFPIFLCISLFTSTVAFAQELPCGSSQVNNEMLRLYPEKAVLAEQMNREALEYTSENYGHDRSVVRVIPVVVHIIHNNGPENISKEQVLDAIRIINEDFRGQNADLSQITDAFAGITADSEFEFRLAKLDPNGNCTDGITRTVSTQTFSAGDAVKSLVNWNTSMYLNIWVATTLENGAGGYAYYPGWAPGQDNEGIVIRNAQFGSIGTSNAGNSASRSLSHEIGHYFNLAHTWGNSNDNAVPENCNDDDGVSDTPNTIGTASGCNLNQVTCGSLDNVENYMDYSSCGRMFTEGQKARMQSAAQSSAGDRNNLWSSTNRLNTGTNNGFEAPCTPTIEFLASNTLACEGATVQFTDVSWGADQDETWSWNWNFPGGTPSSSTEQNPVITYNQAGSYSATLTINTGAGPASETQTNLITIGEFGNGQLAPYSQGMEDAAFPSNPSNSDYDWSIEAGSATTWQRNTIAAATGAGSARINLRVVSSGTLNSLISPPINMSAVASEDARLTFKVAHAPRSSGGSTERLRVYSSNDCGETWQIRYTKAGSTLSTIGNSTVSGTFTPSANQWRSESVNLATAAGQEHVLFKFEALSDGQNYLYLDDINILAGPLGIEDNNTIESVSVVPNPISDNAILSITSAMSSDVRVAITDALGRTLGDNWLTIDAGTNAIPLNKIASISIPGVYFVTVYSGLNQNTIKLVK
jgi:PKD repeat protein